LVLATPPPPNPTPFSEAINLPDSVLQPQVAVVSSVATRLLQVDLEEEQQEQEEASVLLERQVALAVLPPQVTMLSAPTSPVALVPLRTPLAQELSVAVEASARLAPVLPLALVSEAVLERLSAVKFHLQMEPPILPSTP
jgi:hypothetical protein